MKTFLKRFLKNESGQSLTEVVIALAIGAILIGGASTAIVVVLQSSKTSQIQQSATVLTQEIVEEARVYGLADWSNLYSLDKSSSTKYFFNSSSTELFHIEGTEGVVDGNIQSGLVGHWKLDEAAGALVYDFSGNGNDGSISGATATSTDSCKVGMCYDFDGVDYISAGDPADGILDFGTDDFSLSAWFYMTDSQGGWASIISKGGSGYVGYGAEISSSGIITCSIQGASGSNQHVFGSTPSLDSWHNVICVFDRDGLIYVYLDGALVGSDPHASGNDTSVSSSNNFTIGKFTAGTQWYFDGRIDEIRAYDRALSDDEVDHLFNSTAFDRYFYVDDACRTNDSNYEPAGATPCDAGEVEDPSTLLVTGVTEWEGKEGESSFSLSEYVTRWRNETFRQTDWSGGSGYDSAVSSPTTGYSSSTDIDVSSLGEIKIEGL